jgi:hypothetical protein
MRHGVRDAVQLSDRKSFIGQLELRCPSVYAPTGDLLRKGRLQ